MEGSVEWPPLVINDQIVLVKFYELKCISNYKSDCDFLMALLEQHEFQNGGDGFNEVSSAVRQTRTRIKQENQYPDEELPLHEYLLVECKTEQSENKGGSKLRPLRRVRRSCHSLVPPMSDPELGFDEEEEKAVRKARPARVKKGKRGRKKSRTVTTKYKRRSESEIEIKNFGENKDFYCYNCAVEFDSAQAVKEHFQMFHADVKPFKCVVCCECYEESQEFQQHILDKGHDGIYQCGLCEQTWNRTGHLKEHMAMAHSQKKTYPCSVCDNVYLLKRSLLDHNRIKHPKHRYPTPRKPREQHCHLCFELKLESIKALKEHFKELHPDDKPMIVRNEKRIFPCDECDKTFNKRCYLDDHIQRWHGSGEIIPCDQCGKMFATSNSLYKHKKMFHENTDKYDCDQCGKKCYNSTFLRDHLEMHQGIKRVCHVCGKQFDSRFNLNTHVKHSHSDMPRIHSCETCGNKYRTGGELRSHMRVHLKTRTRDFSCDRCDKTFLSRGHYNMHMKWHNGIRPHVCEVCNKAFMYKTTLQEHTRTHTGERPHKCTMCSSDFKHSGALYKHVQLKHKGFKISLKGTMKTTNESTSFESALQTNSGS